MVSFEWHLPEQVYITHIAGVMTTNTLATMSQSVLDMLNAPDRTQPVHLIYDAASIHLKLEMKLLDIQGWTANVYGHPLTASIVTVIGQHRFHAHVVHSMNSIFSSPAHWGRAAQTLNEALRMVHALDSSLPAMNI